MTIFAHDNWSGGEFLALYAALLLLAIYLGSAIPRGLRGRGRPRTLDDAQTAYLAGGAERFFELVVAKLLASRLVAIAPERKVEIIQPGAHRSSGEASVLALSSPADWSAIEDALQPHAETLRNGLVADGQLMGRGRLRLTRLGQMLPYLLLIGLGVSRWRYGNALDHPTGFLTAFLILTVFFALIRWFAHEKRTRSGIAAIEDAQARGERLRRAPTAEEFPLAVALSGTVVLAGSGWGDFHDMRTDGNGGGGGDGGGGEGGGGGCGGWGGCGGCGG